MVVLLSNLIAIFISHSHVYAKVFLMSIVCGFVFYLCSIYSIMIYHIDSTFFWYGPFTSHGPVIVFICLLATVLCGYHLASSFLCSYFNFECIVQKKKDSEGEGLKEHEYPQPSPINLMKPKSICVRSDSRTSDTTCGDEMLNSSLASQSSQFLQDGPAQSSPSATPRPLHLEFVLNHLESPCHSSWRDDTPQTSPQEGNTKGTTPKTMFKLTPEGGLNHEKLLQPCNSMEDQVDGLFNDAFLEELFGLQSSRTGSSNQNDILMVSRSPEQDTSRRCYTSIHSPNESFPNCDNSFPFMLPSSKNSRDVSFDLLTPDCYSRLFSVTPDKPFDNRDNPYSRNFMLPIQEWGGNKSFSPSSSEVNKPLPKIIERLERMIRIHSILSQLLFYEANPTELYRKARDLFDSKVLERDRDCIYDTIQESLLVVMYKKANFLYSCAIVASAYELYNTHGDKQKWLGLVDQALQYVFTMLLRMKKDADVFFKNVSVGIDMFIDATEKTDETIRVWYQQRFLDTFTLWYTRWLQENMTWVSSSLQLSLFCDCLKSFLHMENCFLDKYVQTYCSIVLGITIEESEKKNSWIHQLHERLVSMNEKSLESHDIMNETRRTVQSHCFLKPHEHPAWGDSSMTSSYQQDFLQEVLRTILSIVNTNLDTVITDQVDTEVKSDDSKKDIDPMVPYCSSTTDPMSHSDHSYSFLSCDVLKRNEKGSMETESNKNQLVPESSENISDCCILPCTDNNNAHFPIKGCLTQLPSRIPNASEKSGLLEIPQSKCSTLVLGFEEDLPLESQSKPCCKKLFQESLTLKSLEDANTTFHTLCRYLQANMSLSECTSVSNLLMKLLQSFVNYKEISSVIEVVNLLEKVQRPTAFLSAVSSMIYSYFGDRKKATFYLSRALSLCREPASWWCYLTNDSLYDESSNKVEFHIQGCETVSTNDTMGCITQSVLFYIKCMIEEHQEKEAFQFIASRLDIFKCYPDMFSKALHMLLKSNTEAPLTRSIFDIILSCQPVSTKEAQRNERFSQHIVIDSSIFLTLIEKCSALENSSLLLELIYKFKSSWCQFLEPDLQTWGILIKVLGSQKYMDECNWAFHYMTEVQGLQPCEVTYGCFLDALINNDRVNEALELFEHLKTKDTVRLNTILFSTLAKGFAQKKQVDNALKIHQEMKNLGIFINNVTYNTLVDACARVGAVDKARALLEDMLASNVQPDLITFSTIAKGYCIKGEVARALELLDAMQQRGVSPDGILYNSLLDGCVRASRLDLCENVWNRMRQANIPPSNFTLTILIKMFGRTGDLHQAFLLVYELPKRYGFHINAHVYTCLMSACIANKEYGKALDIYRCMKNDGIRADAKTYETVFLGILRSGNFKDALTIIREAFKLDPSSTSKDLSDPHYNNLQLYKTKEKDYILQSRCQRSAQLNIPGLQMNPRHFCSLWNAMKQSNEMKEEMLQTMNELHKLYGHDILPFFSRSNTPCIQHPYNRSSLNYPKVCGHSQKRMVSNLGPLCKDHVLI